MWAVLPLREAPARFILCLVQSSLSRIMQLQGMSPTPALASEKAVLALHGNFRVFLGCNSTACFEKQIIHGTLKLQQLLPA